MRVHRRRLLPGEFDHELVWLAVSLTTVAAGAVWLQLGLFWPRCPFLAVTGYPCLTCGATRSGIAFWHGDIASALSWNPLAFFALCGVAIFDAYAAVILLTRARRLRFADWTRTEKRAVRVGVILLIAVNWTYLLAHHTRY